ncbi:MAG: hypothetical protein Wins2KO_04520 [Winogradskyella sp.]
MSNISLDTKIEENIEIKRIRNKGKITRTVLLEYLNCRLQSTHRNTHESITIFTSIIGIKEGTINKTAKIY